MVQAESDLVVHLLVLVVDDDDLLRGLRLDMSGCQMDVLLLMEPVKLQSVAVGVTPTGRDSSLP